MVKRKETEPEAEVDSTDVVNVDFDFFDLVDDDFLSIKNLLRQLLGLDSVHFNLSKLTEQIMAAKVGTTIKADDEEYNDALAVIAIADFPVSEGETAQLMEYWIDRARESPELLRALHKIKGKKLGLLVSERLLNMPYEVVPPLYSVLAQEYTTKSLDYDYLLLPSRMYVERESQLDGESTPSRKRGAGASSDTYHTFHVEDSLINKEALVAAPFKFKTPVEETDSRRAFQDFGIHPYGHLAIVETGKLNAIAEAVAQTPMETD